MESQISNEVSVEEVMKMEDVINQVAIDLLIEKGIVTVENILEQLKRQGEELS